MEKKQCFAVFGIKQTHERMSWAGMTNQKDLVVLTIWKDEKTWDKKRKIVITSTFNRNNETWKDHFGNKERIDIIKYCLKELDGKLKM